MSLLRYPTLAPSPVRSSASQLGEFEAAFTAWADDPAKPDAVDLGQRGAMSMVELSRQLVGSSATLATSACAQIGLPPGTAIVTAAGALLRATVDPDGPRCRSFRAACYYLRGLSRLDADPCTCAHDLGTRIEGSPGHLDVA